MKRDNKNKTAFINREQRAKIAKDTADILQRGTYKLKNGTEIDISDQLVYMVRNTTNSVYKDESKYNQLIKEFTGIDGLNIKMKHGYTNDAITDHKGKPNLVVLNFASAKHPGGGFLSGSKSQEEDLARTTTMYKSLKAKQSVYDNSLKNLNRGLYSSFIIHSKGVQAIKDPNTYKPIEPITLNMLTTPAPNRGAALDKGITEGEINDAMTSRVENLIKVFTSLYKNEKESTLILGAFGCGVVKNKPETVARIFKLVLSKYKHELKDMNTNIEFYIPPGESFRAFENELK